MININAAFPLYVTDNLAAQKSFYAETFGFEAVFFNADFYLHLVNPANGIELGFMLPDLENQPAFLHPRATADGMVISFEVEDAAKAYEQALQQGLEVVYALNVEPWKQTHFMVRDPAGLIIDIVEDSNQADA